LIDTITWEKEKKGTPAGKAKYKAGEPLLGSFADKGSEPGKSRLGEGGSKKRPPLKKKKGTPHLAER